MPVLTSQSPAQAWLDALARDSGSRLFSGFRYGAVQSGALLEEPNGIPEHVVCLLVAGSCRATVDGQPVSVAAGDAIWVRPHTPLRLEFVLATAYRLRLNVPTAPDRVAPFLLIRNVWELRFLLDAAVRDLTDGGEFTALSSRSLLVSVLSRMLRTPAPAGDVLQDWQVAAIQEHVAGNLVGRPRVGDLARVVRMSEDLFARRFRRTFGQPPRRWLVCRRIHAAAQRLDDTDESIGQVAAYYGYSDVFFFSRQFKAVLGVGPRAWRYRVGGKTSWSSVRPHPWPP